MKSISQNKGNTFVSVCMATYNGERYIRQQIDSILSQLELSDELIISDDGSTDSTLEIINSYHDIRIKVFHHQQSASHNKSYQTNINVAANFENALRHSNGEYVFLSDQDDIWVHNKIRKMKHELEKRGGVVMSSFTVIKSDGSIKKERVIPQKNSFLRGLIIAKYLGSSMGICRDFLESALPFPPNVVSHDAWLGLLARYQKKLTIIDEPLLLYRRHNENVTTKKKKNTLISKIKYRCYLLYHVLRRSYNEK